MKIAFGVLFVSALLAQAAPPADRVAALKQSLAQNQAALRTYTWIETTQVSLKGEVKKQEQKQCYYGADGKVQKTPLTTEPASTPQAQQQTQSKGGRRGSGRVKQKVVENKVEEMKDYMERVVALVHQYVPPDPQKIQAAQSAGTISTQPSGSAMILNIKNYLKPGDTVAIGFDTTANLLSSYAVQSFVEKPKEDDVSLTVAFGRLGDGTSYPQQILLDAKAKQIQVKVTNSGHKKTGA